MGILVMDNSQYINNKNSDIEHNVLEKEKLQDIPVIDDDIVKLIQIIKNKKADDIRIISPTLLTQIDEIEKNSNGYHDSQRRLISIENEKNKILADPSNIDLDTLKQLKTLIIEEENEKNKKIKFCDEISNRSLEIRKIIDEGLNNRFDIKINLHDTLKRFAPIKFDIILLSLKSLESHDSKIIRSDINVNFVIKRGGEPQTVQYNGIEFSYAGEKYVVLMRNKEDNVSFIMFSETFRELQDYLKNHPEDSKRCYFDPITNESYLIRDSLYKELGVECFYWISGFNEDYGQLNTNREILGDDSKKISEIFKDRILDRIRLLQIRKKKGVRPPKGQVVPLKYIFSSNINKEELVEKFSKLRNSIEYNLSKFEGASSLNEKHEAIEQLIFSFSKLVVMYPCCLDPEIRSCQDDEKNIKIFERIFEKFINRTYLNPFFIKISEIWNRNNNNDQKKHTALFFYDKLKTLISCLHNYTEGDRKTLSKIYKITSPFITIFNDEEKTF